MNHYEIKFSSEKDINDILEMILERAEVTLGELTLTVKKYEPDSLTIRTTVKPIKTDI